MAVRINGNKSMPWEITVLAIYFKDILPYVLEGHAES